MAAALRQVLRLLQGLPLVLLDKALVQVMEALRFAEFAPSVGQLRIFIAQLTYRQLFNTWPMKTHSVLDFANHFEPTLQAKH